MRTINFLSAAAILAATVVTSCSRSADEDVNSNDRVEVKFASAQASVETRVTDSDWAQGDPIGIYMMKAAGTLVAGDILEGVSNRQYKASAGTNGGAAASFEQVDGTIYYPANNQDGDVIDVKFIAYYPYGAVIDNATSFERAINVSVQTDQSAIDFLYAPATGPYNKTSPAVILPFVHKLAKLEFEIGNGAGVTESLDGLTVKITGQLTASTLDLTDGSVTDDNTGGSTVIEALTAGNGATSEAIVLPATDVSAMTFVFTNAANEQFTAAVPTAWEGGKKYTYTVTLKKTEAIIEGTITPWVDVNDPVIAD
jgi:hypothetical protein